MAGNEAYDDGVVETVILEPMPVTVKRLKVFLGLLGVLVNVCTPCYPLSN